MPGVLSEGCDRSAQLAQDEHFHDKTEVEVMLWDVEARKLPGPGVRLGGPGGRGFLVGKHMVGPGSEKGIMRRPREYCKSTVGIDCTPWDFFETGAVHALEAKSVLL